ncbi:MAG: hypothetical protein ACQESN_08825 [Thermotogota bacterium]
MEELEKIVLKKYELELKETYNLFKEISDKDKDVYTDMYINAREYVESISDKNMQPFYKKYLALYTANSEFLNYTNNKKE